ncbi:MAG: CBS domain-containing protein [Rubrivivax sp.]|nr:CBS domain-containing protein [Rubrivivax sp.]
MVEGLTAGQVCNRDVVWVHKTVALNEAARLMRERHVGSLVAIEEAAPGKRLVAGMVTDRDIVLSVVAKDRDARLLRVEDVMTTEVACARETDSVLEVLALMRRRGVRRVPVTDGHGLLIGIVAVDDLLTQLSNDLRSLVQLITAQPGHEQLARP